MSVWGKDCLDKMFAVNQQTVYTDAIINFQIKRQVLKCFSVNVEKTCWNRVFSFICSLTQQTI